jgi:DNA-binding protein H-NS
MKTYSDITARIARLQEQADKMRGAEKAGVVGRIREAIAVYGITAADLGFASGGRSLAKPAQSDKSDKSDKSGKSSSSKSSKIQIGVAKYRDPASGKTWTGRGKPPNWILGAKDRTAFLLNGDVSSVPRARAKASAKAPKFGVAKYRDAATGKTWTGRGKPPTWIAGAADRSQFLIDPQAAS